MDDFAPLLVTLKMDAVSQRHFDDLRQHYFPAARNYLKAHVTLFHKLPSEYLVPITQILATLAEHTHQFQMITDGVMFSGFGSSYTIASPETCVLRETLKQSFEPWLSSQDRNRKFKPHITVQNKVEPDIAKKLYEELKNNFLPVGITARGIDLWYYKGGPWEFIRSFDFKI